MMKNRDTASNPYRVPQQPTQKWILYSIIILFLCNIAMMGSVGYLIYATQECTSACEVSDRTTQQSARTLSEVRLRDGEESAIVRQQEMVKILSNRVDSVAKVISGLQTGVRDLNELCRKKIPTKVPKITNDRSADTELSPRQSNILEMIAQMQLKITNLAAQIKSILTKSKEVCKDGHYRYGVHCFYVGEAALPQDEAKGFCSSDYEAEGSLAIIKDKFVHDFISEKLPNYQHSYWIGIERPQFPADVRQSASDRPPIHRIKGSETVPVPLAASHDIPYAASSPGSTQFDYVDGTKVQNKVWQMWGPKANRHNEGIHGKNCVAMSYDRTTQKWLWQDHDCGARLGYVCQYFIMSLTPQ